MTKVKIINIKWKNKTKYGYKKDRLNISSSFFQKRAEQCNKEDVMCKISTNKCAQQMQRFR